MSPKPSIDPRWLNELIGDIYDAALNEALWPTVLGRISEVLDTRSAILRAQDLRSKEVGTYILHNLDSAYQEQYKKHYVHVDTLVPTVARLPVGNVQQTSSMMPESFFKGEFFNDFALPQRMENSLGCVLARDGDQLAVLGLHRQGYRGDFEAREVALLELLVPHLQRALQINRRLWQLTSETHAIHEALHRLSIGVILVDAKGSPVFLNKQAEVVIEDDSSGLTISRNALRAASWSDTQALHKLIFEAVQDSGKRGGGMAVSTPGSLQPLSILVAPVGNKQDTGFQLNTSVVVAAALFIGTAGQQSNFSLDALTQLYGLTRAEARLAAALANGLSLEMIADQSG